MCDPIGFGASPRLRSTIEQRLRTDASLASEVRKLYGEAVGDMEEELASSMDLLEQEAVLRVQERLNIALQHSPLHEALVRIESAYGEVLTLRECCPSWKLEGVLVEA